MPSRLSVSVPRSADPIKKTLKMVILVLAAALAVTMLARYGFGNLADWHHFIPAAATHDFLFTG